jgi:simple sugar transport system ATP-binding protein
MATIGAPATASGRATPADGLPAIRATGIVKHFGHLQALRGASIDLFPGEVVALVGDNGAGKSTLTKVICGALDADDGQIEFWGEPTKVQSINHAHELGVHTVY